MTATGQKRLAVLQDYEHPFVEIYSQISISHAWGRIWIIVASTAPQESTLQPTRQYFNGLKKPGLPSLIERFDDRILQLKEFHFKTTIGHGDDPDTLWTVKPSRAF